MDDFIVTDKQKERLKQALTEEEYNRLISLVWGDFYSELNDCIVMRFIDDEPTPKAWVIQRIYDEIYNQN